MTPILLVGPAVEPVSLEEAKSWLRLDANDEDQLLSALIVSARLTLEAYTRRFFVTQSWRVTFDAWPESIVSRKILAVSFAPLQSVAAIRVCDAAGVPRALDPASYRAPAAQDGGRIVFLEPPPSPAVAGDGVEIDLVLGYGGQPTDTPEPLRRAMLCLVAHWHENRGDDESEATLPSLVGALAAPFRRKRLI